MKKSLFLTLTLTSALTFSSLAQEKYVEVVVKDTILAEPQLWNMMVHIEKQYDYSMMSDTVAVDSMPMRTMQPPKEIGGTSMNDLKALIKKFNGTIMDDLASVNFNMIARSYDKGEEQNYVNIYFTNRKSMEDFLKAASKMKDVQAQITGTSARNLKPFQDMLDTKLMNKAKERATTLAELGGKKLGNVIFISEATETETGALHELLETLLKYDGAREMRLLNYGVFMDKIRLEKGLKVRFALL